MAIDPNGPLTQYRAQIDANELAVASRLPIAAANAATAGIGYGGISLSSLTAMPDIDSTWRTIVGWDMGLLLNPVNVTQAFATNGLLIEKDGVWNAYAKVAMSFTDVNNGRSLQLRLFNQTQGVAVGSPLTYFVGRDQNGVNIILNRLYEVDINFVGDVFVLQVASVDDTFTGVMNVGSIFQASFSDLYGGF
jgi:hypothetical protein